MYMRSHPLRNDPWTGQETRLGAIDAQAQATYLLPARWINAIIATRKSLEAGLPPMWIIGSISALALILNVPLGAWRVRVPRFSAGWFAAVHLSVPFIWSLRILSGV